MIGAPEPGTVPLPPEVLREAADSYLDWMIRSSRGVPVRGLDEAGGALEVPLEGVYVALRVDSSSPRERAAAMENLRRGYEAALRRSDLSPEQLQQLRWQLEADSPVAEYLGTAEWLERHQVERSRILDVGGLYRQCDAAVVLGAPGSGKTTVARWLALIHARALRDGAAAVRVPRERVDPAAGGGAAQADGAADEVDFGPPRMPIMIRITDYAAQCRRRTDRGEYPPSLFEYLGSHVLAQGGPVWERAVDRYAWRDRIPPAILGTVLQDSVRHGRALIILDGLDEVAREERDATTSAVAAFVGQWRQPGGVAGSRPNKILVTSRIAGYHSSLLSTELTQVTIERMSEDALRRFVTVWLQEITAALDRLHGATGPRRSPAQLADEFWALIQRPENRYVRELCANPLLASSVLCVFLNRSGALPSQRVEVYEEAIQTLIRAWSNRRTGSYDEVTSISLRDALPAVAEEIHRTRPTGVVHRDELSNLLLREFSRLQGTDPARPSANLRAEVGSLIDIMRAEVGLMVESSPKAFRFSHRTFQEYLAARHLVADPDAGAARILPLLGDPGWREPVLMAVELVNKEHPDRIAGLVHDLLDGRSPLADLLPESALLLASAMPNMPGVPAEATEAVATRLLASYATLHGTRRLPRIRRLIERAVSELRTGEQTAVVDSAISAALLRPPGGDAGYAVAVARLIQGLAAPSARLGEALVAAEHRGGAELVAQVTETLTVLVAASALPGNAARPSLPDGWGTGLDLRTLLHREPALAERVRTDPRWLALVLALYGGMENLRADEAQDEFHRMLGYQQLPDDAQRGFAAFFGHSPDPGIPALDIQLDLEIAAQRAVRRLRQRPEFAPSAITRESPLTRRWIVPALRANRLDGLVDILRGLTDNADATKRSEAVLALWALGLADRAVLDDASAGVESAAWRVGALATVLRDATVRAAPYADLALTAAAQTLPEDEWAQLYDAVTTVLIGAGAAPVSLLNWLPQLPPSHQAVVLREEITHRIGGWGESLKHATELADAFNAAHFPPSALISALNTRASAAHSAYCRYAHWWPADPLTFPQTDEHDIPIAVFDQLQRLPPEMSFCLVWALRDVLAPTIDAHDELRPEALAAAWTSLGRGDTDSNKLIDDLDGALLEALDPAARLRDSAQRVTDPWHRTRALLRIAEIFPDRRHEILAEAATACADVTDPVQAFQLHERLMLLAPPADESAHFDSCRRFAEAIPDTDTETATLAFLRLARIAPADQITPLAEQALNRADATQAAHQLKLLRLIAQTVPEQDSIQRAVTTRLAAIRKNTGATHAHDDAASVIGRHLQHLISGDGSSAEVWVPVMLYVRAVESQAEQQAARCVIAWQRLAADPSPATVAEVLAANDTDFVDCTGMAARCVTQAIDAGAGPELNPLLVRLVHPDCAAAPIVRRWLDSPDPCVSRVAALLLAEYGGLGADLVKPIAEALLAEDDLVNARARNAFSSWRLAAHDSVTSLGRAAVESLAEFAQDQAWDRPGVVQTVKWFFAMLLHDDPAAVSAWCDAVEREGDGAPESVSAFMLGRIEWATDAVWSVIVERLRTGSPTLRQLLLHSCAVMVYFTTSGGEFHQHPSELTRLRIDRRRWNGLWDVLRSIDPAALDRPLLLAEPWEIVDAAAKALSASGGIVTTETAARASLELRQHYATSFGAILAQQDAPAVRRRFHDFGDATMINRQSIPQSAEALRLHADSGPEAGWQWVELMAAWAKDLLLLARFTDEDREYRELTSVLDATAAAAELNPDTFRSCTNPELLGGLLADAASHQNSVVVRTTAIRLLGALRHGSKPVLDTLRQSLHDVPDVWQSSLDAIPRLAAVDDKLVRDLMPALYSPSGRVAWVSARLLTAIGRSADTKPKVREEIVDALARAARDPRSRRMVHVSYSEGVLPPAPELDDVFADALRSMYQFASVEADPEELARDESLMPLLRAHKETAQAEASGFWNDRLIRTRDGGDLLWVVRGKDAGRPAWHYVMVSRSKVALFRRAIKTGSLDVSDYGVILESGWGVDPPEETVTRMRERYS